MPKKPGRLKYIYTIPGNPVRVFKSENECRQTYNTYLENKLRYRVTLESQHDNQELIKSPVEALFKFYLPPNSKYRHHRVSITKLYEFVNSVAQGTIYKHDYQLYDVKLHKEYSNNPHTEIIIKPITPKGGCNEGKASK